MESREIPPIQTKHLKISNIHRLYTRLYTAYRRVYRCFFILYLNILLTFINVKYLHTTKINCKFVS